MKQYFRIKGKYKDGRNRVVIEWEENGKTKSMAFPKPEKLHEILDRLKLEKSARKNTIKNGLQKPVQLASPK